MSPAQCKAARAILEWKQEDLARKAKVGMSTVADFEAGRRIPRASSMAAMQAALQKAGVELLGEGDMSEADGVGVRRFTKKR